MEENPYRGPLPADAAGAKPASSVASTVLKVLLGIALVGLAILFLLPTVRFARPAAYRSMCQNNLKQIALAVQNYADVHGALPPAHTVDANGNPLHSWRTLILPYLGQQKLYDSIDLTKPWDDPANTEARETSFVLQCEALDNVAGNYTTYLAVVAPNSAMQADKPRSTAEITDGMSNTLLLVEVAADQAVPWMSPIDASEELVLGLGARSELAHAGGFLAAMVDGRVRFLFDDLPADQRRALISSSAGDKVLAEE